jgi:ribosome-associated protein
LWQLIAIFDKVNWFLVSGLLLTVKKLTVFKITSNQQLITSIKKHSHYLEKLSVLSTRKKKNTVRLTKASKIIKTIIAAIQEKKGENIISLDLRKINEAVADFFIICEAGNQPQIRAIGENIEHHVREVCDENPYHHEGYSNLQWVLIDYVNVVVHVMQSETRKFYQLEEMWSDAAAENHKE